MTNSRTKGDETMQTTTTEASRTDVAGEDLARLEERVEAAREELGAAAVAFEEGRRRRDRALKAHRRLLDELAERLPDP